MIYRLIHADVMDGLRELADESVQCVVTSPPYWGLRDYGIASSVWGGDPTCAHEWGEERAVRRTGGTESSGLGSDHFANGLKPETVKEHITRSFVVASQGAFCACGTWRGVFGLEPTPDMYVEHAVAIFREVRRVLRDDGTLWLNLGDSYCSTDKWGGGGPNSGKHTIADDGSVPSWKVRERKPSIAGIKPKDLVGIPWRVAFALQADGWYLRSEIIWHKPNPMPESVTDRPTKSHEQIFLLSKSPRYFYDADAIREPHADVSLARARRNRFGGKYADADPAEHGAIKSGNGYGPDGDPDIVCSPGGRNKRSVWTVATAPFPEAHFATFPPDLIEPCILAGSRIGDTVLDPFNGSGTTGVVALSHQRNYVGVELNGEYVEMARRRLSGVAPMFATEELRQAEIATA